MPSSAITDQYTRFDSQSGESWSPTAEEVKLVNYVTKQFELCERFKKPHVRSAYYTISFYLGQQWLRYDRASETHDSIKFEEWEEQPVTNYMKRVIDDVTAKVTENRPAVTVVPATSDEDDQEAARASEKLLDHLWMELDFGDGIEEAVKLATLTGLSAIKVYWDAAGGEQYQPTQTEMEVGAEVEGAIGDLGPRMTGIPDWDVLSLMEFGFDPGARRWSKCRWAYSRNTVHIDVLRQAYDKAKYIKSNRRMDFDHFQVQLMDKLRGDRQNSAQSLTEHVEVIEYYERPSPRHPNGMFTVIAGGLVMYHQERLPFGKLPFYPIRDGKIPGRMIGHGRAVSLLDPQHEVNKRDKDIREHANLMAQAKWIVAEGSLKNGNYISNEPGEIVEYNPGFPAPRPMVNPPLPQEHLVIKNGAVETIFELSGLSSLTRGRIPSNMSGRAIGMATDLEATLLGPLVKEVEKAICGVGSMLLTMWRDMMPVAYTVPVMGKNSVSELIRFFSSDISSTDVRMQGGSMLPKLLSFRQERLLMMWERGVFGNPQDPMNQIKFRKMLEFGDTDAIDGDNSRERRYAREVNEMLKVGAFVHPNPAIDSMEIQIDERTDYMQSAEYRRLAPEIQNMFMRNLAWCYYYASQSQQGVPWWTHVDEQAIQVEAWPPFMQEPPPQEGQPGQPQMPQPEPMDAFGMPPEAGPQLPPELMEQMAALSRGNTGTQTAIPEEDAGVMGPGVGEFDMVPSEGM